jgi:hypothetical protein
MPRCRLLELVDYEKVEIDIVNSIRHRRKNSTHHGPQPSKIFSGLCNDVVLTAEVTYLSFDDIRGLPRIKNWNQ